MSVAAEDPVCAAEFGIVQCADGHLAAKAEPTGVQAIESARERFGSTFNLLDLPVNFNADATDKQIATTEPIELMTVDSDVPLALEGPDVALIHGYTHQVRHHIREAVVVVALNPDDLDLSLGVRELADAGEEFPVIASEAAEI